MKNALYKIRMLMLGVLITLSVGTLAQVGGSSGISAPPASDDPSFATLDVSGNSTLGGTLTVTGAVTAASYGGITEANLLDKAATETVSGQYAFTNTTGLVIGTGNSADEDILLDFKIDRPWRFVAENVDASSELALRSTNDGKSFVIQSPLAVTHFRFQPSSTVPAFVVYDASGTDSVQFDHDGTDFNITGTTTTDLNITGFTAIDLNAALDVTGSLDVGGIFESASVQPRLRWRETDAAADNALWQLDAAGEDFLMRVVNDAGSASAAFMTVNRTGTTVDTINLAATSVQISGHDITSETGSFLADTVGCSTELTNNTVRYFRIGIHVTVEIDPNGSTCTSDSTAFFLDASVNAPAWWDPLLATGMGVVGGEFINNGSSATGVCASIDATGDIDFSRTCMGNADWTASGSKGFGSENKSFTFLLN